MQNDKSVVSFIGLKIEGIIYFISNFFSNVFIIFILKWGIRRIWHDHKFVEFIQPYSMHTSTVNVLKKNINCLSATFDLVFSNWRRN